MRPMMTPARRIHQRFAGPVRGFTCTSEVLKRLAPPPLCIRTTRLSSIRVTARSGRQDVPRGGTHGSQP